MLNQKFPQDSNLEINFKRFIDWKLNQSWKWICEDRDCSSSLKNPSNKSSGKRFENPHGEQATLEKKNLSLSTSTNKAAAELELR